MIKIPLFLGLFWSLGFGFQPAFAGERRAAGASAAGAAAREAPLSSERQRRGYFERERERALFEKKRRGGFSKDQKEKTQRERSREADQKREMRRSRNAKRFLQQGLVPENLRAAVSSSSLKQHERQRALRTERRERSRRLYLKEREKERKQKGFRPQSLPYQTLPQKSAPPQSSLEELPLSPLCARETSGAALSAKNSLKNKPGPPPSRRALMEQLRTTPLDLIVKDIEGLVQDLYCHKNKRPVVVNLWATWCPPCIEELPSLSRLAERSKGKVFVLAISEEPSAVLSRFRKRAFPDLSRELKIASLEGKRLRRIFPEDPLPVTYIFQKDGKLYRKEAGAQDWGRKEILQKLLKL